LVFSFSEKVERFRFYYQILVRMIFLFFKKDREIKLIKLEYSDKHIFDNGYLIIRYRFKNALYYKFDTIKTTDNQIKIFDTSNFKNEFDLVVFGLYGKKTYSINVNPENRINNSSFKTAFTNLKNELDFQDFTIIEQNKIAVKDIISGLHRPEISINAKKPKIKEQLIHLKTNPFNETDFI